MLHAVVFSLSPVLEPPLRVVVLQSLDFLYMYFYGLNSHSRYEL